MFVIAAVSLAIRKPFTIQYAYEQVDPKFWDTPGFHTTNRDITAVWCAAFAINALLSYLYVGDPNMIDWVIDILVIVGAVKFTSRYPDFVKVKNEQTEEERGRDGNEKPSSDNPAKNDQYSTIACHTWTICALGA